MYLLSSVVWHVVAYSKYVCTFAIDQAVFSTTHLGISTMAFVQAVLGSDDGPPAPATPGGQSSASWAHPDADNDGASLTSSAMTSILSAMRDIGSTYGGPAQYLRSKLADENDRAEFARQLDEQFPACDDQHYEDKKHLPPVKDDELVGTPPLCIRPSNLGFSMDHSLRPYPTNETFFALVEQFLVDGFLTSGDPLWFACEDSEDNKNEPLPTFWVGYIKGMARACSLLTLLHYLLHHSSSIDLEACHQIHI